MCASANPQRCRRIQNLPGSRTIPFYHSDRRNTLIFFLHPLPTMTTIDFNTRDGVCNAVTAPQAVSSAGTYDLIATITRRGAGPCLLTVTGIVAGTGPLTGLKLSVAATQAGTHHD